MDYGNAVSQKGYDVKTCADRFLVFSSAFQTLKIFNVYSVSTTIPASGVNTITITHNLGYYAPFIVIYNGSSRTGVGTSYFFSDSEGYVTSQFYEQSTTQLTINVNEYFDYVNSQSGDTVYFTVYVFLDDFTTINQQNINTGTSSGSSSSNYGFRISKAGHDVKTCADKDCVISSSDFTHIVHKKGTTVVSTISHNLGYIPVFLCFFRQSGNLMWDEAAYADASNIYGGDHGGGETWYYIIFKNRNE